MTHHHHVLNRMSRRRLMGMAGGAAALSGLGAGLGASLGGTVVAQNSNLELHTAMPYQDLGSGGSLNAFATNGIMTTPHIYGDLMYVPMAMQFWADSSWLPLVAKEWGFTRSGDGGGNASPEAEIDGIDQGADQFTVTLRDDVAWSNGQPCTAQDVVDTFWCLRLLSDTTWEYVDDITVESDTRVSFHMMRPSTVVERYVIRRSPRPSSIYGEWAQKARDLFMGGNTLDDPEGRQLVNDFVSFQPDELVVNGPYVIDISSISNAQLDMVRNESSAFADVALFDRIVNFNGETVTISAVVLSKDVDYATHGFPPATEQAMIDSGIRVLRPPRHGGAAVLFNLADLPEFSDKRARQAVAHIIDRDRNGFVSFGDSGPGVEVMMGVSGNFVEQWIAPEVAERLNPYELDHERAAALLEEAGWTKDGSTWKTPEGADATYDLIFPAEYYSATGIDIAEQLTSFGITINPLAVTFTQVPIDVDSGNFQMAIDDWGASQPHPHFSFAASFFNHNLRASGEGIAFPLKQTTEVMGEVDIEQLVVASGEGLDITAQKEAINEMALVFNELLPIVPIFELLGNNAALEGVRVEAWPADDDPILKNNPYADGIPTMLIYQGRLKPVEG